ncbi:MAG TPA: DUF433 domain-containing protein [Blastocatellia bacterium]|nr:DUF433 domain-containing protein [Blastocatellia bacterium]
MSTTTTGYEHITVREDGVAFINGVRTKVGQLISEVMAYGWSPEELHFQHPHLSMSQIHSALAYYWEHREEIEQQIEADLRCADEMRQRAGESPLTARLKAKGLL